MSRPLERIIRWRWGIIAVFALLIFFLELHEHLQLNTVNFGEFLILASMLIMIGGLVEFLLRSIKAKEHANTILKTRHNFSLTLALINNFEDLNSCILDFFASFTHPLMSSITINEPLSEKRKTFVRWESNEGEQIYQFLLDQITDCNRNGKENSDLIHSVTTLKVERENFSPQEIQSYCFPLVYGTAKLGMLRFMLSPGKSLSHQEFVSIQGLCDEITIAIKSIQQQITLSEISAARAVIAERREISRDLHDILGQNISFLRFKLDYFTQDDKQEILSQFQDELTQMRDVADDSYELVRGVLETLHPVNPVPIANLILNHIRSISKSANFEYKFATEGKPQLLSARASRQIFLTFMEAMRNISRHSFARNVEVNIFWGKADLTINIHDDGRGFDPNTNDTNQHFGLSIMQERIEAMDGSFSAKSAAQGGTEINFSLPLEAIQVTIVDQEYRQETNLEGTNRRI